MMTGKPGTTGTCGRLWPAGRLLLGAVLGVLFAGGTVEAGDILRGGASASSGSGSTSTSSTATTGTPPATALPNAQDRLARTTQALAAVQQMQVAARNLAAAGTNNLAANLPAVPVNSYGVASGLMVAAGVPKDLLNPQAGENAALWTGAKLPAVTTQTAGGATTSTVTVQQTQQQALLNWDSFNLGKNTMLNFDQSAGGTNAGQWIAFNKIGVTGAPSQILGSIQAQGQVYVINPNGIIFGGSSQVNTHALVASSLPINDGLIQRGLLNNPDAQFLFSALPQPAGKGGTPAFTPVVTDAFVPGVSGSTHTLALNPAATSTPVISYAAPGVAAATLVAGTDYTLSTPGADGKMTVTFTAAGLQQIGSATVNIAYTPLGDQYGNVAVQAGAQLTAPTNADHVGGRVALIGPNVTNAGTISTADGQTILAAGLQVGFAPHATTDATLRGLDAYVGAVADPASNGTSILGTVTNDQVVNSNASVSPLGLISAPRGDVTLTGQTVNQLGFIDSSTSVSYNGRVDLVAGYNAVSNPLFGTANSTIAAIPFVYQSNAGNLVSGTPVANSGPVTLGSSSVLRILPEDSTDRIAGDLALPSQINLQGASVYFAANSTLLAPGATVPLPASLGAKPALGNDGSAFGAGVNVQAGAWTYDPFGRGYQFFHTADAQQIYVDRGAALDVAGLGGVTAPVSENIVPVELRGSELANSPLQRNGPLRGQTIQVDVRQHGAWDPKLNGGLGGYTWVGTPLADTSGWVGLATHSVRELSTNGGTVALSAGGAVVVQKSATIDVSGGSIAYQAGSISTTKLVSGGHVYDVAQATPDRVYDGIYNATTSTTDPKWGVTTTSTNPLRQGVYENGYVQGGSGGSLAIAAPALALDGTLRGGTVAGPRQRTLSPAYNPASPPDPASPVLTGVPGWLLGAGSLPVYGQLSIKVQRQAYESDPVSHTGQFNDISPAPPNIVFKSGSRLASAYPVAAFDATGAYLFGTDRNNEIDLSPSLVSNDLTADPASGGFGILRVDNSGDNLGASPGVGNITIKAGTTLALPAGGSLRLLAGNITVEPGYIDPVGKTAVNTSVTVPGGFVGLGAYDISTSLTEYVNLFANGAIVDLPTDKVPQYDPTRGSIAVGSGAVLSTAGNLVDDRPNAAGAGTSPLVMAGGSIALNGSSVTLAGTTSLTGGSVLAASKLDVSGGGTFSPAGKLGYGNAGDITLKAGLTLGTDFGSVAGGQLILTGATLQGYAGVGRTGGSLSLQAPSVSIGNLTNGAVALTDPGTGILSLAPEFFNAGGFSNFAASGLGLMVDATGSAAGLAPAFTVVARTTVAPQVKNWAVLPGGSVFTADSGLQKSASLKFTAANQLFDVFGLPLGNGTTLVLGSGAVIATAPAGSVALNGAAVDVLGRVTAPGGRITVTATGKDPLYTGSVPTLHLGAGSVLNAAGAAVYGTDATGYHKTDVLDGGQITIDGNIVAEKGAVLNASGADDTVQVAAGQPPAGLSAGAALSLVSVEKQSNGGSVKLTGEKILLTNATLLGGPGISPAGTTVADGGDLAIVSNRAATSDDSNGTSLRPDDPVLVLAAQTPVFSYTGLGKTITGPTGTALGDARGLGQLWFGAGSFTGSGFGALHLSVNNSGALQSQGAVTLSATRQITIADGGVLAFVADPKTPTRAPSLTIGAPYVVLGRPFVGPQQAAEQTSPFAQEVSATNGTGSLTVNAGALIDVGNIVLQNAGVAKLDATYQGQSGTMAGAIRGDGTFDLSGALTLKAGQIYPTTATTFNLIASDYTAKGVLTPGSVTIQPAGLATMPAVPLSAGGALNVYASRIFQGGVVRAPLGTIALGVGSAGGSDPFSGAALPVTSTLTLQTGSLTSVSAVTDATKGLALTIPYGVNVNGDKWIDPTGADITAPLAKTINLTADSISLQAAGPDQAGNTVAAAKVDIAGGGDLLAYRFVPGVGGKNDVLATNAGAFAVLPGYTDTFAPYAPYDNNPKAQAGLGGDAGYLITGNAGFKSRLQPGDRVHLEAGDGLPAGDYTILPARYALLPGAFLITPQSGAAVAGAAVAVAQPVGTTVVSGYRFNGFSAAGSAQPLDVSFEVAAQAQVLQRAEYESYFANAFFAAKAASNKTTVPRLPVDAGQMVVAAGSALDFQGAVGAQGGAAGRGGIIDISSVTDILIGSKSVIAGLGPASGRILLDATKLSSYGAASLLIGGTRTTGDTGTTVTVTNNNLTVDNAGSPLTGPDVILVANQGLTLANGAEVGKAGEAVVTADPLQVTGLVALNKIGDSLTFARGGQSFTLPGGTVGAGMLTATSSGTITTTTGTTTFLASSPATGLTNAFTVPAGATITLDAGGVLTLASSTDTVVKPIPVALGDGTLLRVSSDPAATTSRTGVASSTAPVFTLGTGVKLAGGGVTIDSTNTTTLPAVVDFSAIKSLTLNGGSISVLLDQPGAVGTTGSLVLSRAAQQSLLKTASSLSLLSYSTLDFYGTGGFGASTLGSLGLHAGTIRGFLNSTDPLAGVNVAAAAVMLDNAANAAAVAAAGTPAGTLAFDTGTLQLGGNQLEIQNFAGVTMNASAGMLTGDSAKLAAASGGLNVNGGKLGITTPLIVGAKGTVQSISADGRLTLGTGTGTATVTPGLAASLSLTGDAVDLGANVRLPSGVLTVLARTGDVTVSGATLDAGGTQQHFYDVTRFTDGGRISLSAMAGNITIAAGSKVSVSADAAGGGAGSLALAMPAGNFTIAADTLFGKAGAGGQGGSFSLDTAGIPGTDPAASHLATLGNALTAGGFNRSVALRMRAGNVVADGTIRAHEYALAADHGSITVTGTIDASGFIGSSQADPLGGMMDQADPTGGKIDLTASGSVVVAPGAWLTAAGYAYNNAGKGGAIMLSAGSYTTVGGVGSVDPAGVVDVQSGARIDLGVKNAFTPNDLLLNPGVTAPVSTRTDFAPGTLHVRESQIAFGSGAQFAGLAGSVNGASGIVLEGFQVFDLAGTTGTVSTSGAVTSIGTGGLIDSTVENAVKANGTAFVANANPALAGNALFHVQPGAEIVNSTAVDGTVTRNFVTLVNARSSISFNLNPGNGVFTTVLIPGGLPPGTRLSPSNGSRFTVTTADGVTSGLIRATVGTMIASASAANPVVAVSFRNTGAGSPSAALGFSSFSIGATPVTLALDPGIGINSTSFAGLYSSYSGDLTLANSWDLSTYRFGAGLEPGNLTLRARGNLVFGFDASLSDGFGPANPGNMNNPLPFARLMTGNSWSYRLVAGADYGAADSRSVQQPGALTVGSGSVQIGLGGLPLPTTTGSAATRAAILPQFYQTIRTGTGDISIAAGGDVQFLNPLATVYTAGRAAAPLTGFDVPVLNLPGFGSSSTQTPYYPAQYSLQGGDVTIQAQHDIARYAPDASGVLVPDSSQELPTNWLYRRGTLGADGNYGAVVLSATRNTEVQSTSWWVDFSNFFSDVGALGGGQVSLVAGNSVSNINAAVPTNARMPYKDAAGLTVAPNAANLVELGGGNLSVRAGANIDGGAYYVERGDAVLRAGSSITTNSTRGISASAGAATAVQWLPTTFFLGQGRVSLAAGGDVRLGPVANPFLLPAGAGNRTYEKSFFSTFDPASSVTVMSLGGTVTLQDQPDGGLGGLQDWYQSILYNDTRSTPAASRPWLRVGETDFAGFSTVTGLMPATLRATAFAGDINLVGRVTLAPSPTGTVDLLAGGSINGVQPNAVNGDTLLWGSAAINLSDADPKRLAGITTPLGFADFKSQSTVSASALALAPINALFAETGATNLTLAQKVALHGQTTDAQGQPVPLHYNDANPVRVYAAKGDVSGLTLYAGKQTRVLAARDITDIALYVQNQKAGDVSVVAAGDDLIAYAPSSTLRLAAQKPGNSLNDSSPGATGVAGGAANAGDIQVAGPGTLEVLAGRNLDLGSGNTATSDGTTAGITSVGATRNPYLPQNSGANIVAMAGVGSVYTPAAAAAGLAPGLATTGLNYSTFIAQFLDPATAGAEAVRYLPELGPLMGVTSTDSTAIWTAFGYKQNQPLTERQAQLVLDIFQLVLRNSARDRNNPASPNFGKYTDGFAAIAALFPGSPQPTDADLKSTVPVVRPAGPWTGRLALSTREIKTFEGGDISLLAPGGDVTVGRATDPQKPDQGILTQRGGAISIFAADSVNVGTSRIFTLRGGNEIVWSTWGNIAAGSGSKTVFSAPPTRVLVDPQSGDVQNDLAGLATGSGIGVLATLSGVKPGDVDLVAPVGTIDAGDAGIRSSGNLNIAARVILNATNIQVGGTSSGTPPPPAAPNLGALSSATTASAGASSAAAEVARQGGNQTQVAELPSLITVEVLGYGGGDDDDDKKDKDKTAPN